LLYLILASVLIALLNSKEVAANENKHTIFAIDVALGAEDKAIAFDLVKETVLNAPATHVIGLTLFDDTVRAHVEPAQLSSEHIKTLQQTIDSAPDAVRATSNMAVGIERAIDNFTPDGGAHLIVFSRGVIDTETQDPRAKFMEWLDKVLLVDAAQSKIAVSLVYLQSYPASSPINDIFAKTDLHSVIVSTSGGQVASELLAILNIADRTYGQESSEEQLAVAEPATTDLEKPAEPLNQGSGVSEAVSEEASDVALAEGILTPQESVVNVVEQSDSTSSQSQPKTKLLSIIRWVLLILSAALLAGIVYWRHRSRRNYVSDMNTTHSSSSYLPLTQKPGETMDHYLGRETDLAEKTKSKKKR